MNRKWVFGSLEKAENELVGSVDGVAVEGKTNVRSQRDEAVQRHGCSALGHLVWRNDDNRRRVAQTRGGIETVIKAMNNHGSDELLLQYACMALVDLSWFNKEENRKEANERKALIGKAGGVEAVTNAMRLHPTVVSLLKYACWALGNLSANNDNRRRKSFSTQCKNTSPPRGSWSRPAWHS